MKRQGEEEVWLGEEKMVEYLMILEPLLHTALSMDEKVRVILGLLSLNKRMGQLLLASNYWRTLLEANRQQLVLPTLARDQWTTVDCWSLLGNQGLSPQDYTQQMALVACYALVADFADDDAHDLLFSLVFWFFSRYSAADLYSALDAASLGFEKNLNMINLCNMAHEFLLLIADCLPRRLTVDTVAQIKATTDAVRLTGHRRPFFRRN